MRAEETAYLAIGRRLKGAQESQMFGKPCFKVNGKAFMSLFDNQLVFKLTGDAHTEALSLDGSQLFDPSGKGRPMKEWVQVPFDYEEKWQIFAQSALEYVLMLNKQK
nr:TfoX/Sxy family protein [uncultured Fluviicola sp.]